MNGELKWDTTLRDGEQRTTTFRSQRVFAIGSDWYFSTRENKDQGPFISRDIAEQAVESYIQKHRAINNKKMINHIAKLYM